jgi:hypothetical protein
MLLTDVFLIERLQIINEGTEGKTMRVRGVFQRAEESNSNGRIYPQTVLNKQLDKLQPLIEGRRLCGELDHPTNDTVKLSNASHLITKLEMKGNEVIGEAEILNTPAGLTARALINGGVKIGISSRGMGTLSENSEGKKIVNEDFNLITFDLVADPSTRGAYPELTESKRSKFINESKTKLKKESNLVTMLKSRFDEAYGQYNEAKLIGGQENLDVDKDGQIEGSDLASLRRKRLKRKLKKKLKEAKTLEEQQRIEELLGRLKAAGRALFTDPTSAYGAGPTARPLETRAERLAALKARVAAKQAPKTTPTAPTATAPKTTPTATAPTASAQPSFMRKLGQSVGGVLGAAKQGFDAGYSGKPIFTGTATPAAPVEKPAAPPPAAPVETPVAPEAAATPEPSKGPASEVAGKLGTSVRDHIQRRKEREARRDAMLAAGAKAKKISPQEFERRRNASIQAAGGTDLQAAAAQKGDSAAYRIIRNPLSGKNQYSVVSHTEHDMVGSILLEMIQKRIKN